MNRAEILDTAKLLTTGDRNRSYGEPAKNMQDIADAANAVLGTKLSGRDIAIINLLQKLSRSQVSPKKADHYIDGAAYMAIAGECANVSE